MQTFAGKTSSSLKELEQQTCWLQVMSCDDRFPAVSSLIFHNLPHSTFLFQAGFEVYSWVLEGFVAEHANICACCFFSAACCSMITWGLQVTLSMQRCVHVRFLAVGLQLMILDNAKSNELMKWHLVITAPLFD